MPSANLIHAFKASIVRLFWTCFACLHAPLSRVRLTHPVLHASISHLPSPCRLQSPCSHGCGPRLLHVSAPRIRYTRPFNFVRLSSSLDEGMSYVDLQHRVYAHLGRVCFTCLSRKSVSCVNLHASCARLFCLSVHCVQLARVCYMSIVRIDCTRRLDVSASRASFDACLLCVSAICIRCTRPFNVFVLHVNFNRPFPMVVACVCFTRRFHVSVTRVGCTCPLPASVKRVNSTSVYLVKLQQVDGQDRVNAFSWDVSVSRAHYTHLLRVSDTRT